MKCQSSQEEEVLLAKKPKTGAGPPKSLREVAKRAGSIALGIVDNGREDGTILRDEWKIVASAASAVFMKEVRENLGPPPCCESAYKRIVCADERSATMYRAAAALVGEVWKEAKLETVGKKDLPLRPHARVWLLSDLQLQRIRKRSSGYNLKHPTHNWKMVNLEKSEGRFWQALILLNTESLDLSLKIKGSSPMVSRR